MPGLRRFSWMMLGILVFSWSGCGTGLSDDDGVATEPDRPSVDLRVPGVYVIDKDAPGYDPHEIDIICPNGVEMTMAQWIWDQVRLFGEDITQSVDGRVAIAGHPFDVGGVLLPPDTDPEECVFACSLCSDGAFVCTLQAGDAATCSPPNEPEGGVAVSHDDATNWDPPADGWGWTGPGDGTDDGTGSGGGTGVGGWDEGSGGAGGGGADDGAGGPPPGGDSGGSSGGGSSGGGGDSGGSGWDW